MRIETTGTYVDGRGNSFWFRAGDKAPAGLTLRPELSKAGAPENRARRPEENREIPADDAAETPVEAPEKAPAGRKRAAGK